MQSLGQWVWVYINCVSFPSQVSFLGQALQDVETGCMAALGSFFLGFQGPCHSSKTKVQNPQKIFLWFWWQFSLWLGPSSPCAPQVGLPLKQVDLAGRYNHQRLGHGVAVIEAPKESFPNLKKMKYVANIIMLNVLGKQNQQVLRICSRFVSLYWAPWHIPKPPQSLWSNHAVAWASLGEFIIMDQFPTECLEGNLKFVTVNSLGCPKQK